MPKTTTTGPYKGKLPPKSKKALKKYKKVTPNPAPRKRGKPPVDRKPIPGKGKFPGSERPPQSNYGGAFKEWLASPEGQAMMPRTFQADGTGAITRNVTDKLWEGWQKGLRGKQLSGWYGQQKPGAGPGPVQGEDNQDTGQKPGAGPGPIMSEQPETPDHIPYGDELPPNSDGGPGVPPPGSQAGPSATNIPVPMREPPGSNGTLPPTPGPGQDPGPTQQFPVDPEGNPSKNLMRMLTPEQQKQFMEERSKIQPGGGRLAAQAQQWASRLGIPWEKLQGKQPAPVPTGNVPMGTPPMGGPSGTPLGVQRDPYQAALGGTGGGMGPINPPPPGKPELTNAGKPWYTPGQGGQYGGINPGGQEPPSETSGAPAGEPANPTDPRFKKFGQKKPGIDFMGPM